MANTYDIRRYYDDGYSPILKVVYVGREVDPNGAPGPEHIYQTTCRCVPRPPATYFPSPGGQCTTLDDLAPAPGNSVCTTTVVTATNAGRQWMPVLSAGPDEPFARGPSPLLPTAARLSYLSTEGAIEGAEVRIVGDYLDDTGAIAGTHRDLSGVTPYCPRTTGYWGEYFASSTLRVGDTPFTLTAFSDSRTPGAPRGTCGAATAISTSPLHVSAAYW